MVLGRLVPVGVALVCLVAAGCQDKAKKLEAENRDLQAQLADRDARLRAMGDTSQAQVVQPEVVQPNMVAPSAQATGRTGTPGIAGVDTSYDPKAGTMTVNLSGDVLFDPGQATLKDSSKATLHKVAAALKKDYAGKHIRVEGHTDTDPVVHSKDQWKDNLELSLARAAAVTRYLESQGVNPSLITTSGLGAAQPKATKAKSRRVEIVVVVGRK